MMCYVICRSKKRKEAGGERQCSSIHKVGSGILVGQPHSIASVRIVPPHHHPSPSLTLNFRGAKFPNPLDLSSLQQTTPNNNTSLQKLPGRSLPRRVLRAPKAHNGAPRIRNAVHQEPRLERSVPLLPRLPPFPPTPDHSCPPFSVLYCSVLTIAQTDRKLRTSSLASLRTFLSSRAALPRADALKLWKGLYYALWMTDRPLPQQGLAADLADLVFAVRAGPAASEPEDSSSGGARGEWLRAFWAVLAAQWTDIDALRMPKFQLLVRRVVAAHVRLARESAYGAAAAATALGALRDGPLDPQGDLRRAPLGLRLHVLDVWVDELQREGVLDDGGEAARGFVGALGELVRAVEGCPVKAVRERARESCEDGRLPWAEAENEAEEEGEGEGEGEGDEEGWGGIDD